MTELGKSRVPLDKNIIPEKPREFFKAWIEFQADQNRQVFEEIRTAGANQTLFTVPTNKTFYLMNAYLFSNTSGLGTSLARSIMKIGNKNIISIDGDDSAKTRAGVTYNFAMPLRIEANVVIQVSSGLPFEVINAGIVGFLIDKKVSP